jgi:hypothetical protein
MSHIEADSRQTVSVKSEDSYNSCVLSDRTTHLLVVSPHVTSQIFPLFTVNRFVIRLPAFSAHRV